jgi:hypothetical protein
MTVPEAWPIRSGPAGEESGLIASIGRRGLHRLFDPGVLERLALIGLGRACGSLPPYMDAHTLPGVSDYRPAIEWNLRPLPEFQPPLARAGAPSVASLSTTVANMYFVAVTQASHQCMVWPKRI